MFQPILVGFVLFLVPLVAMLGAMWQRNPKAKKYSEITFLVSVGFSTFFSFAYANLLTLQLSQGGHASDNDLLSRFFIFCFSNILIPIAYFVGLLMLYFIVYRRFSNKTRLAVPPLR